MICHALITLSLSRLVATLSGEKIKEFEGNYDFSCLDNPFIKLPSGAVGGRKKKETDGGSKGIRREV